MPIGMLVAQARHSRRLDWRSPQVGQTISSSIGGSTETVGAAAGAAGEPVGTSGARHRLDMHQGAEARQLLDVARGVGGVQRALQDHARAREHLGEAGLVQLQCLAQAAAHLVRQVARMDFATEDQLHKCIHSK
jgi:hypothetical protein